MLIPRIYIPYPSHCTQLCRIRHNAVQLLEFPFGCDVSSTSVRPQVMHIHSLTRQVAPSSLPAYAKKQGLPRLRGDRGWRKIPDLLDEKLALIDKLLVFGAVFKEMRQEVEQLLAVHDEDLLHGNRLVGVRNKDLEDVEALVLDHLAVVAQQVHADLEMLAAVHIRRHDVVVRPIQQDLAQQFDGLPLGDVAVRLDQDAVVPFEEKFEVDGQVPGDDVLVFSDEFLYG
jgi:hypothetical protein